MRFLLQVLTRLIIAVFSLCFVLANQIARSVRTVTVQGQAQIRQKKCIHFIPNYSFGFFPFLPLYGWMLVPARKVLGSEFQFCRGKKMSPQLGQSFVIFPTFVFPLRNAVDTTTRIRMEIDTDIHRGRVKARSTKPSFSICCYLKILIHHQYRCGPYNSLPRPGH